MRYILGLCTCVVVIYFYNRPQENQYKNEKRLDNIKLSTFEQDIFDRLERLEKRYEDLSVDKLSKRGKDVEVAAHSIQYTIDEINKAKEEVWANGSKLASILPNVAKDLLLAEELTASLEKWYAPFAHRKGDMRLAYKPNEAGTLEPFRLYIPEELNLKKQLSLVVGLHGRSGDENSLLDSYGDRNTGRNITKYWCDEFGYILVSPRGGGPGSGYKDEAAEDVVAVTDIMKEIYAIETDQVFLMGHSMGGGGTMLIGLKHPELYRALAPIGGGLWVAGGIKNLSEEARQLPVRYYHGTADNIVPADPRALQQTKEILSNFQFISLKGANHSEVYYEALPHMFRFFDQLKR